MTAVLRRADWAPAFLVLAAGFLAAAPAAAQSAEPDTAAIRTAAEDYIMGWYTGDADRMASALHPALVKRLHLTDPNSGRSWVQEQGKSQLVMGTASGAGTRTPEGDRRGDITILDVFRGSAVVRIDAATWVDYLQLVEEDGRWLILNVLWELREAQPGTGIG
jgi:hypothetical protein